jgi:small-conductance mechanosensitive channel
MAEERRQARQEQQASPPHKPRIGLWVGGIATLTLALGVTSVIVYGYAAKPGWVGVSNKTVWDYLELLIVPAALAIGVAWLNWMQSKRVTLEAEEAQRERNSNEDKQHQRDLLITSQRAQVEALQAYLGHISEMLMDESLDKRLRDVNDSAGDNLRVLARARTLTILSQLEDGLRKGSVLQFLYEGNLIKWGSKSRKDEPAVLSRSPETGSTGVVDLSGADLGRAELRNAFLRLYPKTAKLSNTWAQANWINANQFCAFLDQRVRRPRRLMSQEIVRSTTHLLAG